MKNSSLNLFFQKKEKGFTPSRKSQSDQFWKYFKCLLLIQSFYTVMILIELHDTNMIQQVLPVLENRYKFHTCTSSVLCTVVKHSLCRTCKKTRNPEFLFYSMAGKYKQDTLHQFLLYCNGICGRTCWHSPVFEFPFIPCHSTDERLIILIGFSMLYGFTLWIGIYCILCCTDTFLHGWWHKPTWLKEPCS